MNTLIGKNGYLFLKNGSNLEIECHKNNITLTDNTNVYLNILDKFAMLIYPDKSYLCQQFLPDEYQPLLYRPAYNKFKNKLNNNLFDGLPYVNCEDFYKTDTHLNVNGVYKIYSKFIVYVNNLFNINLNIMDINIVCEDNIEKFKQFGYGCLMYVENIGNVDLSNYHDILYYINTYELFYPTHIISNIDPYKYFIILDNQLIDIKNTLVNYVVNWEVITNCIIYKQNTNLCNKKILVFYDSFSLFIIPLILQLSNEVYIFKNHFDMNIVNIINPDLILELRIERFLN